MQVDSQTAYQNLLLDVLTRYGQRAQSELGCQASEQVVSSLFEDAKRAVALIEAIDQRLTTITFRGRGAKHERIKPILVRSYGLTGSRDTLRGIGRDIGVSGNTIRLTRDHAMRIFFGKEQSPELFKLIASCLAH